MLTMLPLDWQAPAAITLVLDATSISRPFEDDSWHGHIGVHEEAIDYLVREYGKATVLGCARPFGGLQSCWLARSMNAWRLASRNQDVVARWLRPSWPSSSTAPTANTGA